MGDNIKKSAFLKAKLKVERKRYSYCCVKNCSTNSSKNKIRTFKFPLDKQLKEIWAQNCNISVENTRGKFVCESHFEKDCFGVKKLKSGSVPTVLLGHSASVLPCVSKKKECLKKCVLGSCNNTSNNSRLFRFPTKNTSLYNSWVQACGLDPRLKFTNKFICHSHFNPSDLGKVKLRAGAVPIVECPDDFTFEENERLLPNTNGDFSYLRQGQQDKELGQFNANSSTSNKLTIQELNMLEPPPIENSLWLGKTENNCSNCEKKIKAANYYKKENKKLKTENENLKLKNKKLLKLLKFYKSKSNKKHIGHTINKLSHVNENTKEFCKMLLTPRSKTSEWSTNQKLIAQNLNYKSNSTYFFMRDKLGFPLPSKSSLYRWAPIKRLHPGYNYCLMENLKIMVKDMNLLSKQCVLIFDEVKIRKDLVYC